MDKDFYDSFAFHQILRDSIEYRCIRRIFNAGYDEGVRDNERQALVAVKERGLLPDKA